ncbi:MAG: sulfate transporter family protein [Alphaproteobacteria bacterium]
MFDDLTKSLSQIATAPFVSVLFRSLGLVIGIFIVLGAILQNVITGLFTYPWPWLETGAALLTGFGLIVGMWFLIVPVTALVAGFFLDEIAQAVEARHYASDPPGRSLHFGQAITIAAKFTIVVVGVNLALLLVIWIPGVNVVAFLLANGYLLGREYFELVALRHMTYDQARALRRRHRGAVFVAGAILAGLLMVPFVNLTVPLFGTAFMVHVFKRLSRPTAYAGAPEPRRIAT